MLSIPSCLSCKSIGAVCPCRCTRLITHASTSCGAMQPYRRLPGALKWLFRVSPISYVIGALLGQGTLVDFSGNTTIYSPVPFSAAGHQEISCSEIEYVRLSPPSGSTCGTYLQRFIADAGGYLLNPDATDDCQFCSTRTSDQFLWEKFYIKYTWRWWYLGVVCGYCLFNVSKHNFP